MSLTTLVVLSVLAGGSVATESQSTTEITQCTTITEPGTYELTQDLEFGRDDCITIEADDVTIDGNGYSFNNTEPDDPAAPRGYALTVVEQHNVTVRDVTFPKYATVHVDDSTAITIENSDLHYFVWIKYSQDVTLRGNHIAGEPAKIRHSQDLHLVNNHIDDTETRIHDDSANVTARDNYGDGGLDVTANGEAVLVNNSMWFIRVTVGEGDRVEVTRNDAGEGGLFVRANGVARVHNNTVDGAGLTLTGKSDDFIATHNTITNSDIGVLIGGGYEGGPDLRFEHNRITNNDIGIKTRSNLPDIHHNDLSGNSDYGIVYTQDFGVVNATHNYWGDRPSSPEDDDAPFEDPETGTLANGSGSAVSEATRSADDEPGISDIHFDPWLDATPDAGVIDEQSDNDDSNDETTTTTTTTTTTSEDTTTTTTTTTTATTTTATTTPTTTTEDTTTTTTEDTTTTSTPTQDETTTADETTTGDSDTTENNDESPAQTTTDQNTTVQADDTTTSPETTTTTPNGTDAPATNQTTIITGTTESDAPGFNHLLGVIALLGSALLVARHT